MVYTQGKTFTDTGGRFMNCTIRYARGHVEVHDEHGNFLFSADNEYEARNELQAIETEKYIHK